jgi:hypothetical protein
MRWAVVLGFASLLLRFHARAEALLPGAGSNTTTLVIFTEKRAAFTLGNNLQLLNAQLRRVQTRVENVSATNADPSQTIAADYLVVFCPEPAANFPHALLNAIGQRKHPALWVGHGVTNQPTNIVVWESLASAPGFAELLLGFYGVQSVPPARLLLRIEDYHCRGNHRELRRMADLLFARGIPFAVGVLPHFQDCGLEPDSEFVNSLRYVQQRGGSLVLKPEMSFWDPSLDRPATNSSPNEFREVVESFHKLGLVLHAWESAGPAPARAVATEIMRVLPVRIGTIRLSDATASDEFVPVSIVEEADGMTVPDNLGYVRETEGLRRVSAAAKELFALRGAVGSFAFHAYLPFTTLAATVDELSSWNVAFLDLAKLKE